MDKLKMLLESTGFPVAYHHFAEGECPEPPFICYFSLNSQNFFADNKVHYSKNSYIVELYTDKKQPIIEHEIESVLSEYGWEKNETYIETERLYQIIYEIEV